jgi:hypothetical protein
VTEPGGRRQRRLWLLVCVVCCAVAVASAGYVVRQFSHDGLEVSDTAGLLAVALAVAAGLVAVVALWRQSQASTAAFADASLAQGWSGTLARQVEDDEAAVLRQLLGDDTERINLAYRLHSEGVSRARAPGAGRLFADGPGGPALPDIAAYYRDTKPMRLVITGAAGAGKTVCALELLLALIDGRGKEDRVPVRIPLSRWDTDKHSLQDLLVRRLVEAYDWSPGMAAGLVRHPLVLPVLDGLDEMDPALPDGSPDPAAPRATAVMKALNAYQKGREAGPLILTCRTAHYDALARRLGWAARITVQPVGTAEARKYLTDRAGEEDGARWRPLTGHLAGEPVGMLATVLSTPWRLGLTATVHHEDGAPAELLALPDAAAVDSHLLARYIPAVVRTAPNPNGYTADQVHRWLHHLTTHPDPTGAASGGRTGTGTHDRAQATDLVWHELWPLAGRLYVRVTDALLTSLVILLTLPLAWATRKPVTTVGIIFLSALLGGFVAGVLTPGSPRRLDTRRLRTSQGLRELAGGAGLGAKAGGGAGIAIGGTGGLLATAGTGAVAEAATGTVLGAIIGVMIGLVYGLAYGLAYGLVLGVTAEPSAAAPAATRATVRTNVVYGLAGGLAAGPVVWVLTGIMAGAAVGLGYAVAHGLVIGLTVGLTVGAAGAGRRYLVFLLCSRGRLPFRLGRFLDWAAEAGLLRYSGAGYQYRHRELQHWLRQHRHPPRTP